ncbi:NUDIX hydrolase [Pigmentiphaga aceris]|uniref:GDP-mannose pyrophosphatase n=1 Tax=Pigmentiphaga aceris TaxID=1940612 RepID=A0A5C0ATQ9_9BURK|nr:NUDIX hydrolase [Pigmentiphaga aceris]QEI05732.1 NUDIX hydrolase [Pigmentiphaga aceris]
MSIDPALHALSESSERLNEATLSSESVFKGRLLDVRRDKVRLPGGAEVTREYVVHPGAAMVVPLLADGQVLLERQYRYPLHRAFIEFPAGKIDPGESPRQTAERELLEETGYRAGKWTELTTIHNAIGYSDERIVLYLAEDLVVGDQELDEHEFVELFTVPLAQLMAWIASGDVTDVKTIIGAFFVQQHLAAR